MRLILFILALTLFFIYNVYHDGKIIKQLTKYKKIYKMLFYAGIGMLVLFILKSKNPKTRNLLLYANNMISALPIDRNTADMISPLFDFTRNGNNINSSFMEGMNNINPMQKIQSSQINGGNNSNSNSNSRGIIPTKRSVSETKKKYVAAQQNWKCGDCQNQLNAWFEVDHKIRLERGGTNDTSNLVALCRECHGKKTATENM